MTAYRAPALSRGLRVLELMTLSGMPMTMKEIVMSLNLSFNHLYRIIQCLEEEGYLRSDEQGYYYLTDKLRVNRRSDFLKQTSELDACQSLMKAFSWQTNQPCHLAAIKDGQVRVIIHQHPEFAPSISAREGALLNTVKSSSALLLLALADEQTSWTLIRHYQLDATLRGAMVEQLCQIAKQGYAEVPHDRIIGLTSLSWPVIGRDGHAHAAITCPYFDHVPGDYVSVKSELALLAKNLGNLLIGESSQV
ncbi:helix-turn-helix domain-containing protein [Martelella alba]|uniref:HTH iclR-type domain-containing protein n=1 Tax=Martelella alba TaxID=2590451 RepID=A0ABY2SJW7_9HYPH|nr:helix-turn-helix domain-containing protein [Martelella alba]TKI05530.1 hypothetical protein FCN80_14250 [Martelella alba]